MFAVLCNIDLSLGLAAISTISSVFLEATRPPLDFLGLLQCKAAEFRNIPARRVAGHHFADGSSDQVLTSVHVYRDKVDLLVKALQYLFQVS